MSNKKIRALVVDNYSDTWDEIVSSCERAGLTVDTIHCTDVKVDSDQGYDVIILSGGWWYDDYIQNLEVYKDELELIRQSSLPIFGICLGMQFLQLAYSGHIALLDEAQQGPRPISVTPSGQDLLNLPANMTVIKNNTMGAIAVAPGFEVLAESPDHIEIICHQSKPLLGVQFHPELGDTKEAIALFRQLIVSTIALKSRPFMLPDTGPLKQPIAHPGYPRSHLVIERHPALDETWRSRFADCNQYTSAIHNYLRPSNERLGQQYTAFFKSDDTALPNLLPDAKYATAIQHEKRALTRLLGDISSNERNELIKQAYSKRIQELLANAGLYEAALDNDHQSYQQLNETIYGTPNKAVFAAVCQQLRSNVQGWHESNPAWRSQSNELLELLPQPTTKPVQLWPSQALFSRQQKLHFGKEGFYTQLFGGAALPTGVIETEQGDQLLRQMLAYLGAENFQLQDAEDPYWGVNYHPGTIIRPAHYRVASEWFLAAVGHEVGSHLLEWLNGDRQPLRLLGLGLAGYELGNEGRAVLREQIVYPSWQAFADQRRWQDILFRHFTISLAAGTDGKKWNFSELFNVVSRYDHLWSLAHGSPDNNETKEAARLQSWGLVSRSLVGTDGSGGAYYKDIVYLEGNYACWQLAAQNPDVIRSGDLGKVNIADPSHLAMLELMAR